MEMRYDQLSPVPPLTKMTKGLIVICVVSFFITFVLTQLSFAPMGMSLTKLFGLVPAYIKERYWVWQFVTYIFMHGHPLHLLLNMLILWYFGAEIEMRIGEKSFLFYFLLCGIGAGVFNFVINLLVLDPMYLTEPIIGASGAIYGVLAAYGIFFGNRYFLVFFLFPMKAKYFVLLIAMMELVMGMDMVKGPSGNIAHFCHVGGLFVGALYIYLRYVRPGGGSKGKRDYEREKLKKQFTLIVNQTPDEKQNGEKGPYWN
jgi:membrane associated rhomboid family serine protease